MSRMVPVTYRPLLLYKRNSSLKIGYFPYHIAFFSKYEQNCWRDKRSDKNWQVINTAEDLPDLATVLKRRLRVII
jgi:hypothetical protein